jgi:hypothetical protein
MTPWLIHKILQSRETLYNTPYSGRMHMSPKLPTHHEICDYRNLEKLFWWSMEEQGKE